MPRPWMGTASSRMWSSRCTCSQLRTLKRPSPSAGVVVVVVVVVVAFPELAAPVPAVPVPAAVARIVRALPEGDKKGRGVEKGGTRTKLKHKRVEWKRKPSRFTPPPPIEENSRRRSKGGKKGGKKTPPEERNQSEGPEGAGKGKA